MSPNQLSAILTGSITAFKSYLSDQASIYFTQIKLFQFYSRSTSIFYGLPQYIRNCPAWVVTYTLKPYLYASELDWLSVKYKIRLKVLLIFIF